MIVHTAARNALGGISEEFCTGCGRLVNGPCSRNETVQFLAGIDKKASVDEQFEKEKESFARRLATEAKGWMGA